MIWAEKLAHVFSSDWWSSTVMWLMNEEACGRPVYPSSQISMLCRPIYDVRFDDVKVVILGQDPYPRPVHPIGRSFAVPYDTDPLPSSLANISKELKADTGEDLGDVTLHHWISQGVMMLNTRLSVADSPMSHAHLKWETLTGEILRLLDERDTPMVVVAWGAEARKFAKRYVKHNPIITSAHPCKLSASRGFFGSRPFSTVNRILSGFGQAPINWGVRTDDVHTNGGL